MMSQSDWQVKSQCFACISDRLSASWVSFSEKGFEMFIRRTLNDQKGSSLAIVLLFFIVIGALATVSISRSLYHGKQSKMRRDVTASFDAAQSGVYRGLFMLETSVDRWQEIIAQSQGLTLAGLQQVIDDLTNGVIQTPPWETNIGAQSMEEALDLVVAGKIHPAKDVNGNLLQDTAGGPAGEGLYTLYFVDNADGDDNPAIESDKRLYIVGIGRTGPTRRAIIADVEIPPTQALAYALFGNYVHFDNHNELPNMLEIQSSVFSNGDILVAQAIKIRGEVKAVGQLFLNQGPGTGAPALSGYPAIVEDPSGDAQGTKSMTDGSAGDGSGVDYPASNMGGVVGGKAVAPFTDDATDGTPGSPFYGPDRGVLIPETIPFPNVPWADIKTRAQATGTYFASEADFMTYINQFKEPFNPVLTNAGFVEDTTGSVGNLFRVYKPNPSGGVGLVPEDIPICMDMNKDKVCDAAAGDTLGLAARYMVTATNTASIDANGAPARFFYIEGGIDLLLPSNEVLYLEGCLVSPAFVYIHAPYFQKSIIDRNNDGDYDDLVDFALPAIIAGTKIKIDKTGTSGMGGPVHIEGVVYTTGESHLHKSFPYETAYIKGTEIADTVHNCQFFSFEYWPAVKSVKIFSPVQSGKVLTNTLLWQEFPMDSL